MRLAIAMLALVAAPAAADPLATELRGFGTCAASRATSVAQQLLASQPGSKVERATLNRLYDRTEGCVTYDITHAPVMRIRGAVAEGLVATSLGGASMRTSAASGMVFTVDTSVAEGRRRINEQVYGFGQCVVTAQPMAVRALVDAAPDTPEERTAIRTLRPALSPCLPSSSAMSLDRPTLRAVLAESLYRLTGGAGR